MELVNAQVALGGNQANTVPKYNITVIEVFLLMTIHGEDSVFDIVPLKTKLELTPAEVVSQLRDKYQGRDEEGVFVTDRLFPGRAIHAPQTLKELNLDDTLFRPESRKSKSKAKTKADPLS